MPVASSQQCPHFLQKWEVLGWVLCLIPAYKPEVGYFFNPKDHPQSQASQSILVNTSQAEGIDSVLLMAGWE